MIVRTLFAEVHWTDDGCVSHFAAGKSWGAQPHDTPHYHALAHRLGYRGDILRYCREHDTAHHIVAEAFGVPSRVLWPLANGAEPSAFDAAAEEALALALQRLVRTGELPCIDRVDWQKLEHRFRSVLGEASCSNA